MDRRAVVESGQGRGGGRRCLACGLAACGPATVTGVCDRCALEPATTCARDLGTVGVAYGALHRGAARVLVHRLKYDGVAAAAEPLAAAMATAVRWRGPLVPVPRVRARAWSTGIDPAVVLARAVGEKLGLPVVEALVAPIWRPRRAGRRRRPAPPWFRPVRAVEAAILVDDVVTTGATLRAAAQVTRARRAVVATASPEVTSLRPVRWDVPHR